MVHTVFIAIHASAGVIAFAAGCVALARGRLFGTYLWSLVAMAVFLVLAVVSEWSLLGSTTRAVFAAFVVLAGFMVWRALRARRLRPAPSAEGPSVAYFEHVGFTLVALFDAFVVVSVLNAGAPGWLVAAVGVAIAIAGHFVLVAVRSRLVPGLAAGRDVADLRT